MGNFKDLIWDHYVHDTSNEDVYEKLIVPLLRNSKLYKRGVGYFTASWVKLVSKGLLELVENGGKVQLATSPKMTDDEWSAIRTGTMAQKDEMLKKLIEKNINEDFEVADTKEALNLLSWLIADDIIELKIVICKENNGDYHDKLGIFEDDDGNMVVLHGSLNDSLHATFNGEGITTFCSWNSGQDEYICEHVNRFNKMWNKENEFYEVFEASEAIKQVFEKYAYSNSRPYLKKNEKPLKKIEKRDYQIEAIQNLKNNNWHGLLSMATGTGKTITSLLALKDIYEDSQKCFAVIYAPLQHLVEQWNKEFENVFGFEPLLCYNSKSSWIDKLNRMVRNYNNNINNTKFVVVITTYATGSSEDFISILSRVKDNLCIIADECHNIGSGTYRNAMLDNFKYRIGLSATPDRWLDPEGTQLIKNFFSKIVYEYTLKMAIENNKLVKYFYYPIIVSLNYDEYSRYNELTDKISKMAMFINDNSTEEERKGFDRLCQQRAKILVLASSKIDKTLELLKKQYETNDKNHILVYCGEKQIDNMTLPINNIGYKTHKFDSTISIKERGDILHEFDCGNIDLLVAIRCLDEGVDVPSTKTAYFMGSNSNPKQFIQRRGRILRKCEGKEYAVIYDMVVMPDKSISDRFDNGDELDYNILTKELPRVLEFASCADNEIEAIEKIKYELKQYDLEYLLYVDPAELYIKNKEGDDEQNDE